MHAFGLWQLSMLALAAAMVAIGVAGLVGTVTPKPILPAIFIIVALILAFDAGRRFTTLR